jgi:lipoate-protein ligase A
MPMFKSNLNSIFANLATEEALFARPSTSQILFLWRNSPTVTIGRHQNPWKECNLDLMNQSKVTLARRYSGGGAVYQDLGCTTFTFIQPLNDSSSSSKLIDSNFALLTRSLTSLGLEARRKGRNDMLIGEFKVSGSAFKQVSNKLIHHGTILVNTDMTQLGRYLTPSKLKLAAKGISSVSARVSNLSDFVPSVDHEKVCDAISREFQNSLGVMNHVEPTLLDDEIQSDPVFKQHHKTLLDWEWRYGSTPEFSHYMETRLDGVGIFNVHYNIVNGRISDVRIFSDCLLPDLVEIIQTRLKGCAYVPGSISKCLRDIKTGDEMQDGISLKFSEWIISENIW